MPQEKEIKKIIKAWGLSMGKEISYPLYHTKKEALKKRFVEDLVRLEIRIIKRETLCPKKK